MRIWWPILWISALHLTHPKCTHTQHACMRVCLCVCVCVYVCVCLFMFVCMHVCVCMSLCIYACVCVCVGGYACACVYVCVWVCVCVCLFVSTCFIYISTSCNLKEKLQAFSPLYLSLDMHMLHWQCIGIILKSKINIYCCIRRK